MPNDSSSSNESQLDRVVAEYLNQLEEGQPPAGGETSQAADAVSEDSLYTELDNAAERPSDAEAGPANAAAENAASSGALCTWTDRNGRRATAQLDRVSIDSVRLLNQEGKAFEVPITQLGEADQKYIRSLVSLQPRNETPARHGDSTADTESPRIDLQELSARLREYGLTLDTRGNGSDEARLPAVTSHDHVTHHAIAPEGLELLSRIPQLRTLDLSYSGLSDQHLSDLGALSELLVLNLQGNRITDTGLTSILPLKKLEVLFLDETDVTDTGIEILTQLPNLKHLSLTLSRVTNEGLSQLMDHPALSEVIGYGLEVTAEEGFEQVFEVTHLHR